MNDFWNDFHSFYPRSRLGIDMDMRMHMNTNMRQTNEKYIIEAPLAGMTKKDVRISLSEDTRRLCIHAEQHHKNKGGISDRSYAQEFMLPPDCVLSDVQAKMENGLLEVHIRRQPKSAAIKHQQTRLIEVQ